MSNLSHDLGFSQVLAVYVSRQLGHSEVLPELFGLLVVPVLGYSISSSLLFVLRAVRAVVELTAVLGSASMPATTILMPIDRFSRSKLDVVLEVSDVTADDLEAFKLVEID